MKLNEKGFTLIEILAAVAIMSILSGVATMAVTGYIEKTQRKSYEMMQKTVYDAAVSYHHNNPIKDFDAEGKKTIGIDILLTDGYLETLQDPTNKSGTCGGSVTIEDTSELGDIIKSYKYTITLNCKKYNKDTTGTKEFIS